MMAHDDPMPASTNTRSDELLGAVVRDRVAELGLTLEEISAMTGIPGRTLHNTTRNVRPDRMRRYRVARLARALHMPICEIVASNEGVPDEPPGQPKPAPAPGRRQDKEKTKTAPKRSEAVAS